VVHLSTDQVYDGSKSYWKEADMCRPVNEYGRTKVAAEEEIRRRCQHYVILRSSIIVGPQAPAAPVPRPLFLQFIDSSLAARQTTKFFEDEWRSPVYVGDIVKVIGILVERWAGGNQLSSTTSGTGRDGGEVFNMGGPDRLSRVDMAHAVALHRKYDSRLIETVPSASVPRGVVSPADISMDSSKLESTLGIQLTPLQDCLAFIF